MLKEIIYIGYICGDRFIDDYVFLRRDLALFFLRALFLAFIKFFLIIGR